MSKREFFSSFRPSVFPSHTRHKIIISHWNSDKRWLRLNSASFQAVSRSRYTFVALRVSLNVKVQIRDWTVKSSSHRTLSQKFVMFFYNPPLTTGSQYLRPPLPFTIASTNFQKKNIDSSKKRLSPRFFPLKLHGSSIYFPQKKNRPCLPKQNTRKPLLSQQKFCFWKK